MSQILDKIHDFCVQNPGHLKLLIDLVYVRLGATIFFDCCVTDLVLWAIFGVTNFVFFRKIKMWLELLEPKYAQIYVFKYNG